MFIQRQVVRGAFKCRYWLTEYISCSNVPSQLFLSLKYILIFINLLIFMSRVININDAPCLKLNLWESLHSGGYCKSQWRRVTCGGYCEKQSYLFFGYAQALQINTPTTEESRKQTWRSLTHTHMHTRTHARTHTRTHVRTHTHLMRMSWRVCDSACADGEGGPGEM